MKTDTDKREMPKEPEDFSINKAMLCASAMHGALSRLKQRHFAEHLKQILTVLGRLSHEESHKEVKAKASHPAAHAKTSGDGATK